MKKMVVILLTLFLALTNATTTFACTGVYVGEDLTDNGSSYMGRSEDISDVYGKVFGKRESFALPEMYEDTYGFKMVYADIDFEYPNPTYAYTYIRDSYYYGETMQDSEGNFYGEAYAEAGMNEKNVAVTATTTISYNASAKAADKLVYNGLCEVSIGSIVLAGASTAREGVELLAAIIDEYGAGECNSIMIADPNETWLFENVSGHQYVAVKLASDKVVVQPNISLIDVVDVTDSENVIASKNLVSLAEENGFLVTDESGKINVTKTYGRTNTHKSSTRYWQGLHYFNPTAAQALDLSAMESTDTHPLYLESSNKNLTTYDVLRLLAYRGEGTAYDSNVNRRVSAIGNGSQTEVHIFETRKNMPADLAILQWQGMADAEFTIYMPHYSSLVKEVADTYKTDLVPSTGVTSEFLASVKGFINWDFQIINNWCYKNRENCAEEVKAYFEKYQKALIEQQKEVDKVMLQIYAHDKELAKDAATALAKDLAAQVQKASGQVRDELEAYLNSGSNDKFALSETALANMPNYAIDEAYLPEHDFEMVYDEDGHWKECTICDASLEKVEHKLEMTSDENTHEKACEECDYVEIKKAEHTFEDGTCTICGEKEVVEKGPETGDPTSVATLMTMLMASGFVLARRKR